MTPKKEKQEQKGYTQDDEKKEQKEQKEEPKPSDEARYEPYKNDDLTVRLDLLLINWQQKRGKIPWYHKEHRGRQAFENTGVRGAHGKVEEVFRFMTTTTRKQKWK